MDIVESEGNEQAMNFYDVKCDTTDVVAPVDLGELERLSPVKEYGTYAQDGEVIQYMVYKDVMVSVHMQQTDEYGKYFTVDMRCSCLCPVQAQMASGTCQQCCRHRQ